MRLWSWRKKDDLDLPSLFRKFRELLDYNNRALELMADMGEKLSGDYLFDRHYLESLANELEQAVYRVIYDLNLMVPRKYSGLFQAFEQAKASVQAELDFSFTIPRGESVYSLSSLHKEMSDLVGEKMATLGEIRNRLGLAVPEGFVVSTPAYKRFVEYNQLQPGIDSLLEAGLNPDPRVLEARSKELGERILESTLPPEVDKAIRRALSQASADGRKTGWAVRSSAVGEDTQSSYAGQYRTLLNLQPSQFAEGYKTVVASLFSPQVITYRQKKRLQQKEMAMAVGFNRMISPRVSGVLYTTDPTDLDADRVIVSACWGLGRLAVEGEGEVDQYTVSRTSPHPLLGQKIGKKEKQYVLGDGGISLQAVSPENQVQACLGESSLRELVEGALRIEQYMKCFQDIEWSIDAAGRIFFLQARPLEIRREGKDYKGALAGGANHYPVLLNRVGVVASRGIGAGTVFLVRSEEEARNFPRGAVLVLKHGSPRMAKFISMAAAVVTDIGAVTGHMATLCREFRVPTIVDTLQATRVLQPGMEVTVDAEENVIYRGIVRELLTARLIDQTPYEETYEFKLLRRLFKKISTLHLTDPQSEEFTPLHCTTYHDIIRFAHEMAVARISQGIHLKPWGPKGSSRRVKLPIPLDLAVVDIGGGIQEGISAQSLSAEQLSCTPLRVLLEALSAPGVWQSLPVDMDVKGFMSSLTQTNLAADSPKVNVAIISKEYVNLSLWLGFHFNMIDGYLSEDRNSNYLYFRFSGGVTEITRRTRRAKLLGEILEKNDFAVETKGDLVIARIKKIDAPNMEERFRLMGRLIGFSRQLDILLRSERDIEFYVDRFFREEMGVASPSV
jgi:pyruvate,water dikinase